MKLVFKLLFILIIISILGFFAYKYNKSEFEYKITDIGISTDNNLEEGVFKKEWLGNSINISAYKNISGSEKIINAYYEIKEDNLIITCEILTSDINMKTYITKQVDYKIKNIPKKDYSFSINYKYIKK